MLNLTLFCNLPLLSGSNLNSLVCCLSHSESLVPAFMPHLFPAGTESVCLHVPWFVQGIPHCVCPSNLVVFRNQLRYFLALKPLSWVSYLDLPYAGSMSLTLYCSPWFSFYLSIKLWTFWRLVWLHLCINCWFNH